MCGLDFGNVNLNLSVNLNFNKYVNGNDYKSKFNLSEE